MGLVKEIVGLFSVGRKVAAGHVKEIKDAVALANAIKIFEQNHEEMRDKYVRLRVAQSEASEKLNAIKKLATVDENATETQKRVAKVYESGVEALTKTINRLEEIRVPMCEKIKEHSVNIELLKAKLTLLDAMKYVNENAAEVDSSFSDDNIMELVNAAIATEAAVTQVNIDLAVAK